MIGSAYCNCRDDNKLRLRANCPLHRYDMTLADFAAWVGVRWAKNPRPQDLAIMALGLAGEAGEVIEPIKKQIRGTHPEMNRSELLLELGDVLHYLCAIANYYNLSVDDIIQGNITKLNEREKRYAYEHTNKAS